MSPDPAPTFACDAMLGALARWLRAAGYDAWWDAAVSDPGLIRLAQDEGRVLLSTDTGIFRYALVRDGKVAALQIPNGLGRRQQLAFVLGRLRLPLREPRCMACGGALVELPRDEAAGRVPPRSFAWVTQFYDCSRCHRLFWHGTHWQRIVPVLRAAAGTTASGPP